MTEAYSSSQDSHVEGFDTSTVDFVACGEDEEEGAGVEDCKKFCQKGLLKYLYFVVQCVTKPEKRDHIQCIPVSCFRI